MRYPASVLLAALVLSTGCSGDGGSVVPSGSVAAPATPATPAPRVVGGQIEGASAGTLVMLLEAPRGSDLRALGDSVIDLAEVDADGGFRLSAPEGRMAERVLVSAPGRGLLSVSPEALDSLRLAPEAVVTCRVLDDRGQPLEDAMALVLDPNGVVLPLPPVELVSGADGLLRATRLPAGACEILISAVDAERFGLVRLHVDAGQTLTREVRLADDPELRGRFMRAVGAPEIPGLGQGGAR